MKHFSSIMLILMLPISVWATHQRGGTISYKRIADLSYQITVTTYSVADSPADRPELPVNYSDGTIDTVPRANGDGNGVLIANGLKENIYITTHNFTGPGTFQIWMEDPNRNPGILNIPMSVSIPMYLYAELTISPFLGNENSVMPLAPAVMNAISGEPFVMTVPFEDADGNLLTFELVTCRGADGQEILRYSIPTGVTLSEQSGEFIWDSPSTIGSYSFAILIKEWDSGNMVGSTVFDFQIDVHPGFQSGSFELSTNWPTDQYGNPAMTVFPDDVIEFDIGFHSGADSVGLNGFCEAFGPGEADLTVLTNLGNEIVQEFNWVPSPSHVRCAPYIFVFRAENHFEDLMLFEDATLMVYVDDPNNPTFLEDCSFGTSVDRRTGLGTVSVYPNPTDQLSYVSVDSQNAADLNVEVLNPIGQVHSSFTFKTKPGINNILINVERFESGLHLVRLSDQQNSTAVKLMVK